MKDYIVQINPDLREVLGDDFFAGLFNTLQTALDENKVQVNESSGFRLNFKHMLEAYPGATFLSTGSLATSYLWNEKDMESALRRFIDKGGTIKQIFYVRSLEEAASVELQITLDLLRTIGIAVHVVNSTCLPANSQEYFIFESRGKIGWKIPVNERGHVEACVITSSPSVTAEYRKAFETLWESAE